VVIGTEHEPEKARAARAHFQEAGLTRFIDLREGDLRETLRRIDGPVDFTLVDIWIPMARPALELIAPHLRRGSHIVCDNTEQHRVAYADYFAFINDPAQQFRTMTLPFAGFGDVGTVRMIKLLSTLVAATLCLTASVAEAAGFGFVDVPADPKVRQ
jgi:predicted O-methyltransferase YrrM